jgi:beta-N-acetylhexosaminidase
MTKLTKLRSLSPFFKGNGGWFKKVFALALLTILAFPLISSKNLPIQRADIAKNRWVDSVFNSLTEDQRLGQLFMVAAYSNKDESHYREIENLIRNQHIGGLIFFQGGPGRQAVLTNRYQKAAKVPLLIGMDLEWGLQMRLDSTLQFPKQMTLGALSENSYIYEMGAEIARQCKELGVHVNFAPVVDVNVNPENPVIGYRAFGEKKENVARKGVAYMKGMQDNGVLASAKHFPGHGDTDTDSHYTLPVIKHSRARLDTLELYPFRELIKEGVASIMVAHIHIPSLDDRKNMATTLSPAVVTKLLKEEMGYTGLIFTDALNMKGVSQFYKPGEVDLLALKAGNDVLLFAENVPEGLRLIKQALANGELNAADINQRIKKILAAKYDVGLNKYKPIKVQGIAARLNTPEARILRQKLYEKAFTVVENQDELLPFQNLQDKNFASLSIGMGSNNFQQYLSKYAAFSHYQLGKWGNSAAELNAMKERLKKHSVVVVGLHGISNAPRNNHGISPAEINMLRELQEHTKVVVMVFGNPYSIRYLLGFKTMICAYEDNETTRQLAPQMLFGGFPSYGTLPVSPSRVYPAGWGQRTEFMGRFIYTFPEEAGMDSKVLNKIDEIVEKAIFERATPGAQIVVARKGAVIYSKNFGHLSYDKKDAVTDDTIYDLASLTKVLATLQALMFLHDREMLDVNANLQNYLPQLRGTNKGALKISDILTHQAGLIAFIPHWQKTVENKIPKPEFYSRTQKPNFENYMVDGLYGLNSMRDSVWNWTIASDLLSRDLRRGSHYIYRYSDIGFYLMHATIEQLVNQPLDDFMHSIFYAPLGLSTMGYLPLRRFPAARIAPTEDDKLFRSGLVRGVVHDQGAAMYGGVAGHAGLFANANDVAILMQMNLQNGFYGNHRFLIPGTIERFASKQFPGNRRGLGWDRPTDDLKGGPTSELVSKKTFGHTGFTGTAAWVDPEYDLVYVFLSNRVHPDANNQKLITQSIRTKVQDVIYESIRSYDKNRSLARK